MTIGILIGLGMTIFATFIISLKGDSLKDYEGVLFFIGIAACLLFGLIGYEFDINEKINNTIKTTINTNYDNALNYHNDNDNKSFISDGSKYTFEYNEDSKTLTVLKGSDVDAVFIDGAKQKTNN
jgi:hypothetical protein